jgi:uncharacterized protein YdcH (DUF465 family)
VKGLAEAIKHLHELRDEILSQMDNIDPADESCFAKENRLDDALTTVDRSIPALQGIYQLELEDYK